MKAGEILTKRTKIVCTIGPSSSAVATLQDMIKAGMNIARINFSHGSYDSNLKLIEQVRKASEAVGKPIAILQDLQGPKIRVGQLPKEGIELVEGATVVVQAGMVTADPGVIPVPYDRLAHDLSRGDRILLADGTKELEVLDVRGKRIRAKVLLGGTLLSHKGINVPTVSLSAESMTEKDDADLAFGLKQNIDFVALSFVRSAVDVKGLRQKIKRHLPTGVLPPAIIVKVEKHEALHNFDEILEATDAIMIARGDLGLETPVSLLPVRQKEIIAKCLAANKPVITATEMLGSMELNPRPTRAEVSDVANAVIDHTDAVMLSGETATGRYPVGAVQMMSQIIQDTETSSLDDGVPTSADNTPDVARSVAAAAAELTRRIKAAAILVTTASGYSARAVTCFRPTVPIIAATENHRTRQQLQLSWGITTCDVNGYSRPEQMTKRALEFIKEKHLLKAGATVVVVSGLKRLTGGYDSALRVVEL